jgi:hypothetical protein
MLASITLSESRRSLIPKLRRNGFTAQFFRREVEVPARWRKKVQEEVTVRVEHAV